MISSRHSFLNLLFEKRGWIFIAVTLGWLLGLGTRLTFPAIVPHFSRTFDINLATAGLLLSVLWAMYAIAQLPGGFLADLIGERRIFVVSKVLAIAGLLLIIFAESVLVFSLALTTFGIASGLYATTRFTIFTDVFPEHPATAIGLCAAIASAGTVILPVGVVYLTGIFDWQSGLAFLVPVFLVSASLLWLVIPHRTSNTNAADTDSMKQVLSMVQENLLQKQLILLTVSLLLMLVVYQGFTSFYPSYLVHKGFDEGTATLLYGLFLGMGIVVQPTTGIVADTFGSKRLLIGLSLMTAVAVSAMTLMNGLVELVVLSVLMSAQLAFMPVAQAFTIEFLFEDIKGTGFGLIRSVYLLLATPSPWIIGTLADMGYFDEGFLILGLSAVVASLCILVLRTG